MIFVSGLNFRSTQSSVLGEAASPEGPEEQTWVLPTFSQDKFLGSRCLQAKAGRCDSPPGGSPASQAILLLQNCPGCHPTPPSLLALGGGTQLLLADLLGTLRWLTIAGVTPVPCAAPRSAGESANPAAPHLCPQQGESAVKPFPVHETEESTVGITVTTFFEE